MQVASVCRLLMTYSRRCFMLALELQKWGISLLISSSISCSNGISDRVGIMPQVLCVRLEGDPYEQDPPQLLLDWEMFLPYIMHSLKDGRANLQKGCILISQIVARFSGSASKMQPKISLRVLLASEGIQQVAYRMDLYSSVVEGLSNGKQPKHIAQRMTPVLQISACNPSQGLPDSIQGQAQQGLPQAVVSEWPALEILLSPKSMSLILNLWSSSRFSGFKSRCDTPSLCRYSIASMICMRNLLASNSVSFYWAIMWSKSSPRLAYSITKQQYLLVSMISQSCEMLGCRTFLRIFISRSSRTRSASSSAILLFSITLMATCYRVSRCLAMCTLLKVPLPISGPNSKLFILLVFL